MKKLLFIAVISASSLVSCNNDDAKDDAFKAANQKITVDVVAVDNDETETESGLGWTNIPK